MAVYDEYVPTAAILAATEYHISPATLDSLLGVNFQADLTTARRAIDGLAAFRPGGRSPPTTGTRRPPAIGRPRCGIARRR